MVWKFARVIAHRGGGILAPENTIAGIAVGSSYGFKGVEFDVMLTKDRVPVLMHDDSTGRTVRSLIPGVGEHTSEELLNLDAGSWFDTKYSDVRVPLFRDVMNYCNEKQIWMNIEIKPYPGFEYETGTVVAQETRKFFEALPQTSEDALPLFSSFSYESLQAAKIAAPGIPRGYLIHNLDDVPDWKAKCHEINAYSVHICHKHLTPELAEEIKKEGFGLFCYTVNKIERAKEIISWGVDSFCTDRLDLFADFRFPEKPVLIH